jgi:pectinesterase
MKTIKTLLMLAVAVAVLSAARKDHVTTIFVIGDSTAANKGGIAQGKQERGWGMALQAYFDPEYIRVDNHAVNGRSSKSFIDEGRWDKVLEKMRPGDYVIIQFGHNDEKPKADRHTDPGSTFDYNLARFVRETREHGGIPVLMNAVVRRNFAIEVPRNDDDEALRNTTYADGPVMMETDTLVDTHGLYRVAPRDVARRMNAHFVDANAITHDLEQGMGKEESKKLHMWFLPGQEPSEPKGKQDNTHYNVYGAHQVARLLADALCEEVPVLSKYRVSADVTVDAAGRGQFLSLDKALEGRDLTKPWTIQILGGSWQKPLLPKKSKVTFILREGATWK